MMTKLSIDLPSGTPLPATFADLEHYLKAVRDANPDVFTTTSGALKKGRWQGMCTAMDIIAYADAMVAERAKRGVKADE